MGEASFQSNPNYVDFLLHLADTNLILGQRLCEWCGHAPILEQDIAMSNIALDLIGQSRNFYQYAAELLADGRTEDDLAYLRTERDYKNLLITELKNGDFGATVLRQFFFDAFQLLLMEKLVHSKDLKLAAIAEKSIKETKYHFKWSAEWVIRLGDVIEESHQRMEKAIEDIKNYTGEMFVLSSYEKALVANDLIPDVSKMEAAWKQKVQAVLDEATLSLDFEKTFTQKGGKEGRHTEHLGFMLAELQYMQRAYPNLQW